MRMAGRLTEESQANQMVNYLCFQGIKSHTELDGTEWLVWVEDENQIVESKEILLEYKLDPRNPKFNVPVSHIDKLQKESRKHAKFVKMSDRWDRSPSGGNTVVTTILITLSVVVALVTNFGHNMDNMPIGLFISNSDFLLFPPDYWGVVGSRFSEGLVEVRSGEVWRLITPVFIHLSPLHLIFNVMFMVFLAVLVESKLGFWKFLVFILGAAILPNLLQYYFFGPSFGGMSGVGYAVFAYLWLGSKWFHDIPPLDDTTVIMAFIWLILGFTGTLGVAIGAHGGGFLFGALWIIINFYFNKFQKPRLK